MDYKSFPIQNTISSGNIENSLNRIVQMQKASKLEFIEPSTVTTPSKIVDEMLEELPSEIWNHNTRFLNIACKDGIYLIKIFQKLMESEEMKSFKVNDTERAWYILENQLYAICVDETIANLLITLLYGQSGLRNSHITWFNTIKDLQKLTDTQLKQYIYNRFKITGNIDKKETEKYMNFDVVIGNPPYNRGGDIDFVNLAYELSRDNTGLVCMITPAKWQTAEADQKIASSMSYGEFRKKLVPHMKYVCFYPDCKDVFSDAIQTDGITWFIIEKHINYSTILKNKCSLKTVLNCEEKRDISNGQSLMNKGNSIVTYLKSYCKYDINKVYTGRYEVYISDMLPGSGFYRLSKKNTGVVVISPFSVIDTQTGKIYNQKGTQSGTDSSVAKCVFKSDSIEECNSFISWLYSKFTRFFIIINISTRSIFNKNTFKFVPAPPSGKFDHIYTDEELYKAFNLPQEYIDVIETVIKERR